MIKGRTIRTLEELLSFVSEVDVTKVAAADVETYKQRPTQAGAKLLGLSVTAHTAAGDLVSAYIVFWQFDKLQRRFVTYLPFCKEVSNFVTSLQLVGWNVPFDKMWIDYCFKIDTKWHADGRIMWHLQNNDHTIRGFGLKLAQKKLLGWEETNERVLEDHVKMAGGKLANGDHYLADLDILSHYANLDTYSTLMIYNKLKSFMNYHNYWEFGTQILQFAILLNEASNQGLPVDDAQLLHAAALYDRKRQESIKKINQVCEVEINAIEDKWKVEKASGYKKVVNRDKYLNSPVLWRKFNPSSGVQREMLIHTMLEFPIRETTPTGRAKTDRANLSIVPHEGARRLVEYSEYKKISEQARTYLNATEEGFIYTNYDVCGTVSGRLSGFRPSVLNMPFSESEVMSAFKCIPGFVGIHADLASIEPCVLAHYSEDPTLLKVYREGRGDIYLDLATDIFPDRSDLKQAYSPDSREFGKAKQDFKDLRNICKTIHLAVSYTGTHITVAKNLTKAGYPTTKGEAMQLVGRYWKKFSKVKAFNHRLQEIYEDKGYIRNVVGRIILVPHIFKKDLMNRLIQSSAHDILRIWIEEILNSFTLCGVVWRHWLPDIHDSTTFMIEEGQEELARQCYLDALKSVEKKLGLSVPLKCEIKFAKTLAGLKGNEL